MNKLIGQHLIIGISGHTLTPQEASFIVENNIGGIVLFGRNLDTPEQIHDLCCEIQSLRHKMKNKAPLFIGIDMEGGRVARLKKPFTLWPPLQKLGDLDNSTVTFNFSQKMSLELNAVGINLDFAPCLDIFSNPQNTVIGDRALGTTAEIVEKHASALIRGFIKSGILSCAKHFPGHGNTLIDSHDDLPIEEATWHELEKMELIPFKKAIRSRVDMIMTSHIRFSKIDPTWPVTLSHFFVTNKLRNDLRYRGLIVTDDLDMRALTNNFDRETIAVQAVKAGVDLLLYCNDPSSPEVAIEALVTAIAQGQIKKETLEESALRILAVKKEKLLHPEPPPITMGLKLIGCPEHKALSAGISNGYVEENLLIEL